LDSIQKNGFYVRVPSGKQFYLYVLQTIDDADASLGGIGIPSPRKKTNHPNQDHENVLSNSTGISFRVFHDAELTLRQQQPSTTDAVGVRYPEVLHAYHIGRYADPNDSLVLHEQHVVYRVEENTRWDFHPGSVGGNTAMPRDAALPRLRSTTPSWLKSIRSGSPPLKS